MINLYRYTQWFVAVLLIYVAFFVYVKANSVTQSTGPKVKIDTTKPASTSEVTDQILIEGAYDNLDGTTILLLNACGTMIKATVSNKDLQKRNDAVLKVLTPYVKAACEGGPFTKGN